jgi:hypothetical protein
LPTRWDPHGSLTRWDFPVSGHPLVVICLPGPESGNPNVITRGALGWDFLLRGRRSLHDHDRARARWARHGGDSRRLGGRIRRCGCSVNGSRWHRCGWRRRRSRNEVRLRLRSATGEEADYATDCDGGHERTRAPNFVRDRDNAFHDFGADSGSRARFAARRNRGMGCATHGKTTQRQRLEQIYLRSADTTQSAR